MYHNAEVHRKTSKENETSIHRVVLLIWYANHLILWHTAQYTKCSVYDCYAKFVTILQLHYSKHVHCVLSKYGGRCLLRSERGSIQHSISSVFYLTARLNVYVLMLIKNEINCASPLTRKHTTSLATENARGLSYDQTISIVFHPTCTFFWQATSSGG